MLFNNSLSSENEGKRNLNKSIIIEHTKNNSFPTLQELESYDRMPRIYTNKETETEYEKNNHDNN